MYTNNRFVQHKYIYVIIVLNYEYDWTLDKMVEK